MIEEVVKYQCKANSGFSADVFQSVNVDAEYYEGAAEMGQIGILWHSPIEMEHKGISLIFPALVFVYDFALDFCSSTHFSSKT